MIRIVLLIIVVFANLAYSQENKLVFHYQVQKNYLASNYDLIIGKDITVWKETSDPEQIAYQPNYIPPENYQRQILFKDHQSKKVFGDYNILGVRFLVADSLYNQSWQLIDSEPQQVLGYNCHKAKTFFRGREYEVLYTNEIPIDNGPWKFGGLPGMILKVVSKGNGETYKMECIGIEKHDQNTEEVFDRYMAKRKRKKFLSWGEFINDFNLFLDRYVNSLRSEIEADEGGGFTINIKIENQLEIFSDEAQKYGILIEL